MSSFSRKVKTIVTLLTILLVVHARPAAAAFDFDNGNALFEVVGPFLVPAIFSSVSSNGNDASLVLRVTTLMSNAWFDAIAPYHETAVGVYSRLGRRPASERATNRNKNIALLYASYRMLNSLLPQHAADWKAMLTSVGLDSNDASTDNNTPVGIGNNAGNAVVRAREHDGMNQLGDEGGRKYNRQPYADYTGYAPVNSAYELTDPSRWQPAIVALGNGAFRIQQFVTPQYGVTTPYSYDNPNKFKAPTPSKSNPNNPDYKKQADEVLAASAALTDYQKMTAELFDNKLLGLGQSIGFVTQTRGLTLDQFVQYDLTTGIAAFDAGIATWKEKARHDAVRPFSAIRYLYGDRPVTAWGGPGKGTVSDIKGNEWRSYLNTADHPEYPSGSACLCAAHAQASRRFLGTDALGWSVPFAKGSSGIEPGITPATDIVVGPFNTWSDFEQQCGFSRFWGGVHFMSSILEGETMCRPIGDLAYEFVQKYIQGRPPR